MPSIPQSLLWISLVVLWLFVLVPMLVSKRDTVRRTSDVALATRVLNSGAAARLIKRAGPAAGHRSDPEWRREGYRLGDAEEELPFKPGSTVVMAADGESVEPEYLDVDVVEEQSAEVPVTAAEDSGSAQGAEDAAAEADGQAGDSDERGEPVAAADGAADGADAGDYEYVEDSSGLEAEAEQPEVATVTGSASAERRRRRESATAEAVSARKYAFRKRVLTTMALILVGSAAAAFMLTPSAWWACGAAGAVTVLYLGYLRRQTRIEEQVRSRRRQRMARSRPRAENADGETFEVVPARLRRPGAAVLEIDDEDPAFEHLAPASAAREYGWRGDLPRAAGQ
ncbi:MAG TPA: gephyrin-like molybdotransferase receptor GlpR [Mycobacterium sp.]|nr:gephyrin-like molybdotransferase receptor GlpR [Mycobacterium sp.]